MFGFSTIQLWPLVVQFSRYLGHSVVKSPAKVIFLQVEEVMELSYLISTSMFLEAELMIPMRIL
jgi:hypothetical protein